MLVLGRYYANECRSFGLSFMGQRFSEAKLIGLAYAYEQRTLVRNKVQPYIVPNTELPAVVSARQARKA